MRFTEHAAENAAKHAAENAAEHTEKNVAAGKNTAEWFVAGKYNVAIVGAGHAGCEAALACARLGVSAVVFAINLDTIANMPCNPSIGGPAKGHLVREIDALGGEMAKAADATLIQSRILNRAKGPAVYSLRAQIDRRAYQSYMKNTMELTDGLDIKQAEIVRLLASEDSEGRMKVTGVMTHTGTIYEADAVILATGTFLRGKIIIGDVSYSGGPDGLFPAAKLSESLKELGIKLLRFKTGTPARLNRRSIDFSRMEIQSGDEVITNFSFETPESPKEQVPCHLTYTNEETHNIIRSNLHRSPLYGGLIEGIGPRYCPSIEDKVVRFADRERHQVFVEPMGSDTQEMYLQGMSTSLPEDVQIRMVRSLPGLENASIMRSAYAIEYDCIEPRQLELSLEVKNLSGLFSAGQINGSSGYEEAAAQGLMAGINAVRRIRGQAPFILDRSQAYIGVLIDDLCTKGTNEPYRMMTSRAEYRLLLRQDNADMRLTLHGYELGLVTERRYAAFMQKKAQIEGEKERLKTTHVAPDSKVNGLLAAHGSTQIKTGASLAELLKRPEISYNDLEAIDGNRPSYDRQVCEQVEIQIKYEGYINRQIMQIEQFGRLEKKMLPADINYNNIRGLSTEAKQKLEAIRPLSIGQASRISGVSPADISVLLVYLEQSYRSITDLKRPVSSEHSGKNNQSNQGNPGNQ